MNDDAYNKKFDELYNDTEKNKEYTDLIKSVLKKVSHGRQFDTNEMNGLIVRGWNGISEALKTYDPEREAKFTTYAYDWIRGELIKELKQLRPVNEMRNVSFDDENKGLANKFGAHDKYDVEESSTNEQFDLLKKETDEYNKQAEELALAHRQSLQLLNILMSETDDEIDKNIKKKAKKEPNKNTNQKSHTLTLDSLNKILAEYNGKTNDSRTTSAIMRALVFEMNRTQNRIAYDKKGTGRTNFRYIHPFTYEELDHIIEAVVFSGSIPQEEKTSLVGRLANLSSRYYETVFYNKRTGRMNMNNNAIFTRTFGSDVSKNIRAVQEAINNKQRIAFRYNDYSADNRLVPRSKSYELSPHQIVVYHDMYYLIGSTEGSDRLSHYRIDLMSEITPAKDGNGNIKKRESMVKFKELRDKWARWQPDKYMSEHLYMDYDSPRLIRIKIKNDQYRVLHDWFGDHFEKSFIPCEDEGYDYVNITTSPKMIVYWAMQYSDVVEIMDKDVREKIGKEAAKLADKYGKNA